MARLERPSADPALLLHLLRVLALYLAACLSRSLATANDELAPLLVAGAQLSGDESRTADELDALLGDWVAREAESNQFDGLLPEHGAFLLIKRFFRQHEQASQVRVLSALLTAYLARLREPLVACGPADMVRSTLEYLLTTGKVLKAVSPALLYPLVNAVDSLSVEQRDCLEALTSLLQGLQDSCNLSDMELTKFMSCHHRKFILIEDLEGSDSKPGKMSKAMHSVAEVSAHLQALGVCFIKTLLCHSDHIFRRDPEFASPSPLLDSETEDEDFSEHSPTSSPLGWTRKELTDHKEEEAAAQSRLSESSHFSSADTDDADEDETRESPVATTPTTRMGNNAAGMTSTRSLRKRKKREQKVAMLPRTSPAILSDVPCSIAAGVKLPVDADESHATMAIAAAAGTLAAVLCVIFA